MPTYLYQEILPNGEDGDCFEIIQRMSDPSLKNHPTSGNPVKKIFHKPNLPTQYSAKATKNKLSDANVEKLGFTRYERDSMTGRYHKTAGRDERAPDIVDATTLKAMQEKAKIE